MTEIWRKYVGFDGENVLNCSKVQFCWFFGDIFSKQAAKMGKAMEMDPSPKRRLTILRQPGPGWAGPSPAHRISFISESHGTKIQQVSENSHNCTI
jgi:hypothetical protein